MSPLSMLHAALLACNVFFLTITTASTIPLATRDESDSSMSRLTCMDSSSCFRDASAKSVECFFQLRNETRNINGSPRTMQLVNGQFPGPCIQAMLGDEIRVHVYNQPSIEEHSSQNVSIHWHGMDIRGAVEYDGTPLTQCPLREGASMTYRFPADTPGTLFWHSHYKLSLLDGVWGPLIVHDEGDPYLSAYDEERILSVTDFANETAVSQFEHWKEFESAYYYSHIPPFDTNYDPYPGRWWTPGPANDGHGDYYNWTYGIDGALIGVIPWVGGLINGKTANTSDPAVVQVEAGKTYRLRILSASAFYPLQVSIDGHRFDVIAADGSSVVRTGPYDYLNIHAGERYDILVNATVGSPGDRFWIRARTQEIDLPWHQTLGVLSYGDANPLPLPAVSLYKGNVTGTRFVNCFHDINSDCVPASELVAHPHVQQSVPANDSNVAMHFKFIRGPLINAVRFTDPVTPPLFSNGSTTTLPGIWPCAPNATYESCTDVYGCNCTQVVSLTYDEQIRLTMDNLWPAAPGVSGVHPFHLHGHHFAVLGQGYNGPYNGQPLNQVNPSFRDTIIIPAGGWTVVQFAADNPGTWMGHCHMEHHLNDGMTVVFSEAQDRLAGLKPPKDFPYCDSWNTSVYEGTEASVPKWAANPALFPLSDFMS